MLGNFQYCNPTKLYFGEQSLTFLKEELQKYGPKVQLSYGRDSIKKNGIYDQIMKLLKEAGKTVFEDPGVMPNPTVEKLYEGCKIARENEVDLILAVGGGSVCDYAKAVSVSAYCEEDPWEKYYERMEEVDNRIIPVGCVLTMVGTGSEMNGGSVITNTERKRKIDHVFGENVFPKFSILNPVFTYTLPKYQMVAGIYDIFNHITEQYFSGEDDNTSDYVFFFAKINFLITANFIRHQICNLFCTVCRTKINRIYTHFYNLFSPSLLHLFNIALLVAKIVSLALLSYHQNQYNSNSSHPPLSIKANRISWRT